MELFITQVHYIDWRLLVCFRFGILWDISKRKHKCESSVWTTGRHNLWQDVWESRCRSYQPEQPNTRQAADREPSATERRLPVLTTYTTLSMWVRRAAGQERAGRFHLINIQSSPQLNPHLCMLTVKSDLPSALYPGHHSAKMLHPDLQDFCRQGILSPTPWSLGFSMASRAGDTRVTNTKKPVCCQWRIAVTEYNITILQYI